MPAGTLPEQHRETVKIEYQADPARQAALVGTIPTDERFVLFIGMRRFDIQDVHYVVGGGRGTFRDVDGRVVPLASRSARLLTMELPEATLSR